MGSPCCNAFPREDNAFCFPSKIMVTWRLKVNRTHVLIRLWDSDKSLHQLYWDLWEPQSLKKMSFIIFHHYFRGEAECFKSQGAERLSWPHPFPLRQLRERFLREGRERVPAYPGTSSSHILHRESRHEPFRTDEIRVR